MEEGHGFRKQTHYGSVDARVKCSSKKKALNCLRFSPDTLKWNIRGSLNINKYLFDEIYDFAGQMNGEHS